MYLAISFSLKSNSRWGSWACRQDSGMIEKCGRDPSSLSFHVTCAKFQSCTANTSSIESISSPQRKCPLIYVCSRMTRSSLTPGGSWSWCLSGRRGVQLVLSWELAWGWECSRGVVISQQSGGQLMTAWLSYQYSCLTLRMTLGGVRNTCSSRTIPLASQEGCSMGGSACADWLGHSSSFTWLMRLFHSLSTIPFTITLVLFSPSIRSSLSLLSGQFIRASLTSSPYRKSTQDFTVELSPESSAPVNLASTMLGACSPQRPQYCWSSSKALRLSWKEAMCLRAQLILDSTSIIYAGRATSHFPRQSLFEPQCTNFMLPQLFTQLFESTPVDPPTKPKRFKRKVSLGLPESQPYKLLLSIIHPQEGSKSRTKKTITRLPSDNVSETSEQSSDRKPVELIDLRRVESAAVSQMGFRNYENMENQDVLMEDQISNRCKVFGIFDGHGQHGRQMALTTKQIFLNLIQKNSEDIKNQNSILSLETIVKKALDKTNKYLRQYKQEQSRYSGTAALIVFITPFKIYSFHIGNSRLVLAKHYSSWKSMKPFQLTHDHTLNRFDERLRIIKKGGEIRPFKNERGQQMGPDRIWAKDETYPGMITTRSLGMLCSEDLGISSDAEGSAISMQPSFKILIMASDGFWDVFSNEEAVSYLQDNKHQSLNRNANQLVELARERWREQQGLADDISVILISFE